MVKSDPVFDRLNRLSKDEAQIVARQHLAQTTPLVPLQLLPTQTTIDHILVSPNSHIAVVSMDEGRSAADYAGAMPHWQVHAWLPDMTSLVRAQRVHALENLDFDTVTKSGKRQTLPDVIVGVCWAHHVYSHHHYNLNMLASQVQELLAQLPHQGQLVIQDVALPENPDQFVLLDLEQADAVEALVTFSRVARPQLPAALRGFFLEKLTSPRAGATRFRLTAKWATEFFHRWRLGISVEAPYELTTLAVEQWAALIEQCGARAVYRAPHFLKASERKEVKRVMTFYDENEKPIALPAASFTLVAQKIVPTEAVAVYERRPSETPPANLFLKSDTDPQTKKEQQWIEVASTFDDVLLWRRDSNGEIRVCIRADVPRPIINTVPRGTVNLDGRRWAGYLTEALVVPTTKAEPDSVTIARALNLDESAIQQLSKGITYYPAPDYLAQRVRGLFAKLDATVDSAAITMPLDQGRIIEVMANDVLRAIQVGLIPDSGLHILIGSLFQELGEVPKITGEALTDPELKPLIVKKVKQPEAKQIRKVSMREDLEEFLSDKGDGAMRCARSVFVADQSGPLGRQALQVAENDFIVPGKLSANTAICIPLVRDPMKRFLVGSDPRKLPIPALFGDAAEPMDFLPSFRLPETVTTIDEVIAFLASRLQCKPDDLTSFGNSFFVQPHLSPERVYPFLFHAPDSSYVWSRLSKPKGNLGRLYDRPIEKSMAYVSLKAQNDLGEWYMGLTPDIVNDITARVRVDKEPSTLPQAFNDNSQQKLRYE